MWHGGPNTGSPPPSQMEYDVCAICDDGGSVTCCDGGCQRAFHLVDSEAHDDCREKLGLTLEQAKTINKEDGFICKNCQFKHHQCFACGLLGSSDDTSSQPEVFQCEHEDCGRFYHPKYMHECMECKGVENKNDKSMQFAVCRRCPTVYHRKCLPSDILFKSRKGPNGSLQRAWDDILPDRILMYCMKHKIVRKLLTPERNHIIFPEVDEHHVPETLEGAAIEQDMPEEAEPPHQQDVPEEAEPPSSEQIQLPPPPPAASAQTPCSCSRSPLASFAPSSLYKEPQPGNCGWISDESDDE